MKKKVFVIFAAAALFGAGALTQAGELDNEKINRERLAENLPATLVLRVDNSTGATEVLHVGEALSPEVASVRAVSHETFVPAEATRASRGELDNDSSSNSCHKFRLWRRCESRDDYQRDYGPGYAPGYAPGYTQPDYMQPGYMQPGYARPGYTQPGYAPPPPGPIPSYYGQPPDQGYPNRTAPSDQASAYQFNQYVPVYYYGGYNYNYMPYYAANFGRYSYGFYRR